MTLNDLEWSNGQNAYTISGTGNQKVTCWWRNVWITLVLLTYLLRFVQNM